MSGGPKCVLMEPEVSRMRHSLWAHGFEKGTTIRGPAVDEVPGHAIEVSISVPVARLQQANVNRVGT